MKKKFNRDQYSGLRIGDLSDLTMQIKAKDLLSKGLKNQKEKARIKKINAEVSRMLKQ